MTIALLVAAQFACAPKLQPPEPLALPEMDVLPELAVLPESQTQGIYIGVREGAQLVFPEDDISLEDGPTEALTVDLAAEQRAATE